MKNKNRTPEKSPDRLSVLEKIEQYERNGFFDQDVENDPPTTSLLPGQVDYTLSKRSTRIKASFANKVAHFFFEKKILHGELVIGEIRGIENYIAVKDKGVVITCNHFNAFDNYAVYKAIEPYLGGRDLYKIIREGNYTSFPGLYGFFFRHCNTLPLSSDLNVLKEMMRGVSALLERKEKILIYPEQGMWWNYRKPRPLKLGAFQFASRSNVPVLPMFITLTDTDNIGSDGFPIQSYTIHILPAIYPDENLRSRANSLMMCEKNYAMWKQTYEDFYKTKLAYTTPWEVKPCSM